MNNNGVPCAKLDTQRRMHPDICALVAPIYDVLHTAESVGTRYARGPEDYGCRPVSGMALRRAFDRHPTMPPTPFPHNAWRMVPSPKGPHIRTPGGTNRHTHSALMAHPPPTHTNHLDHSTHTALATGCTTTRLYATTPPPPRPTMRRRGRDAKGQKQLL